MATIQVRNLIKTFDHHTALQNVSFEVPEHIRCVGFLGPNGSGKTTTIRILTGLLKPSSGSAEISGINVTSNPDAIRSKIGYVEQHPALISWMTGLEFLVFIGRLFHLSNSECRKRAEMLLQKVGLTDAAKRRIGGYSGGMKKRLDIAQALMGNPEVLFLDEPVAEMDPIGRVEILHLIEELKQEVTIFMSSHILEDIERTADQIIILHKGQVRSISTLERLKQTYSTTELLLEVESRQNELLQQLQERSLAPIESVDCIKERLHISLKSDSCNSFDRQLQDYLHQHHYIVKHYEWMKPNLEEIFMKVVNES